MSKRVPTHIKIRSHLLKQIQKLPPNSRLPTEVELAARFGVSRLTAHKAVARLQQEGLVVRRRKGGTFVAREAHLIHADSNGGRSGSMVIAYPNWFSADIWFKVDLLERRALEHGMTPVNFKMNPDTEVNSLQRLCKESGRVRGIVMIPPGGALDNTFMRGLEAIGVPVVLLAVLDELSASKQVYSVAQDYFLTGKAGAGLLIRAGHTSIAYVANEPWRAAGQSCYDGMRQACTNSGHSLRNLKRSAPPVSPWQDAAEAGLVLTRKMMKRSPTALIFDSHAGAIAGLRVLHDAGLSVPDDVSMLVNADEGVEPEYMWPKLALVAAPRAALVEKAMDIILHPPKTERVFRLPPVVREHETISSPPRK